MNTSPSNPARRSLFWPVFLIVAFAILAAILWLTFLNPFDKQPIANPNPFESKQPDKLSRDDSLKLVDLRNQSVGYLENHDFPKADEVLVEISQMLPRDPFGPRNLAICRQLALKAIDKQRDPDAFVRATSLANTSIRRAFDIEPDSYVPRVIAARVAETLDQLEDAMTQLREARHLGPDAVGPAYDIYQLSQLMPGEKAGDEGIDALRFVSQKEPHNLFVMKDWLPLVVKRHAPESIDALTEARQTIEPFAETIKIHTQKDVREILNAATTAAKEGQWPIAERSVTMLKNLVLSESARDNRYVKLDSLEYVISDFNEESRSRLQLPVAPKSMSRPIHFSRPDESARWPEAPECHDLAMTDFDLDGIPDLVVLQSTRLDAWGRKADEQVWTSIASESTGGAYIGLLAFDFDDDVDQNVLQAIAASKKPAGPKSDPIQSGLCHTADPDAILFGPSGLKLMENRRSTADENRSLVAIKGGEAFDAVRDVIAACVADIDSDGDLDLVVSTETGIRVFSNRGNLTFEDITQRSVLTGLNSRVTAMAIVDWDRDSDIDVVIATEAGGGLLENVRHGRLRYRALDGFSAVAKAATLRIGDFDGNGSWDMASGGPAGTRVTFTNRTQAGLVNVQQTISVNAAAVRSMNIGDFDNDGALDVVALTGDGVTIWLGDGAHGFSPNPRVADDWLKNARAVTVGDLDRDGDLDLVASERGDIFGLSSQCQETDNPDHGWLEIQMVGERVRTGEQNWDKRVNHINLGGMLEVKTADRYQPVVVTGPVSHFGLGKHRHADIARILWTNGIPSNVIDPAADVSICIEQKLGGSCPYLYTWNGKRFEFVTDLLWNAPLGLMFAETVVAPWREWEYLKIDGCQLKPVQKEYQLRIAAELWEAEYFDQVQLLAIDHPVGTDIYTNEKVGPASIAEHKIHTVHSPRKPVAARDTRGRDVLPQVIARDGNYTKTFDKRIAQGYTEEHFLELDLGEFSGAKRITLFLTGWMYPGSTSLRVQLSQNPNLPPSRPPAIFAPDAKGEWSEVCSYMGFPGGKTKTIVVDVSDMFTNDDHRLRIVSTMELFWDEAFFTVDDEHVDVRQTALKLVRADVVDRGKVSARSWPESGNGPDQFHYDQPVIGEMWPAMDGLFTRFGDVLPLLTTRDDHLVVMGSGDEMRLSFAEPPEPLQPGWVRDFVIYTVGWDKDADQNTIYGECVEPLPFEAMTVYAHRDGESRPLDAAYVEYLRTYQTRRRNPSTFWKSIQQHSRNPSSVTRNTESAKGGSD